MCPLSDLLRQSPPRTGSCGQPVCRRAAEALRGSGPPWVRAVRWHMGREACSGGRGPPGRVAPVLGPGALCGCRQVVAPTVSWALRASATGGTLVGSRLDELLCARPCSGPWVPVADGTDEINTVERANGGRERAVRVFRVAVLRGQTRGQRRQRASPWGAGVRPEE